MKKTLGTAVAMLAVLTLAALCVVFSAGGAPLTENQLGTLRILLTVCGCSIVYCFAAGELTQNFSQMDKLWSLLPVAYVWITAARSGFSARCLFYAVIVTLWGARLTFNFGRKGAYRLKFWTGNEDYRWSVVRSSRFFSRGFAWTLFDLLFISVYQNLLVLAITLPSLAVMEQHTPLRAFDYAAIALSLAFLALETVSDEYQWRFHKRKKELLADGGSLDSLPEPYRLGFNTTGPWAYMRHPNYLGEQGFWLSLCLFAAGAGVTYHVLFHWSFVGPLMLVTLFAGSSSLGEKISSSKYPAYKDYAGQVLKYIPLRRFDPDKTESR